jgi:hypothetical protein
MATEESRLASILPSSTAFLQPMESMTVFLWFQLLSLFVSYQNNDHELLQVWNCDKNCFLK